MGRKSPIIAEQKYSRLTAVRPTDLPRRSECIVWEFLCECGSTHYASGKEVARGNISSCGCLNIKLLKARFTTHGATVGLQKRRSYRIWAGMKKRCLPGHEKAHRYYERGIKVCDRWQKYENFLADMGEPPLGTSIDRINNDGDYEPGNCRWTDDVTQSANRNIALAAYIMIDMDFLF